MCKNVSLTHLEPFFNASVPQQAMLFYGISPFVTLRSCRSFGRLGLGLGRRFGRLFAHLAKICHKDDSQVPV